MKSSESAAGVIASMLQGTMHIGPAWDELEKQKMLDLVSRWETQIRLLRGTALETIVGDIATEPDLSRAWDACGLEQREYLQLVMRTIIDDTVA